MALTHSYGELGNQLIVQSKLSLTLSKLLPYDGPLARLVVQEQHELNSEMTEMEESGVDAGHQKWPALVILARVVHQNKRCLLQVAYHSQRLDMIRMEYWKAGGAVTHVINGLRDVLSQDEIQYLRQHHESVSKYRDDISPNDVLDLTNGIEDPPRALTMWHCGGPPSHRTNSHFFWHHCLRARHTLYCPQK
ncbi:hypothetical protein C8J57DRAFT_1518131 [Mycena rebaudengoi]|nr:hypothetical protein C8J57DRAFT_1518131 [Mycena rebaudengoi]